MGARQGSGAVRKLLPAEAHHREGEQPVGQRDDLVTAR
jgi:hypothetical protein